MDHVYTDSELVPRLIKVESHGVIPFSASFPTSSQHYSKIPRRS